MTCPTCNRAPRDLEFDQTDVGWTLVYCADCMELLQAQLTTEAVVTGCRR